MQFFDPLYGYLNDGDVFLMWELLYGRCESFSLQTGMTVDRGDGYYEVPLVIICQYRKQIKMTMKAFLRIENNLISEYSHAFSVHEWCRQMYGLTGNLLGWNRLYQQRIKNNARRELLACKL